MKMFIEQNELNDFFFFRFKGGDELAFEKIFKSNYNKIVGFCNNFVNDSDEAKNLAQEAFINLWLSREKIETINGINYFLYTFSKSKCLNFIRHKKIINKYEDRLLEKEEDLLNVEVLESINFNSLEFIELEELIKRSVGMLPERCRQVFIKSRYEDKKNKKIAEELNISVKAVEANMTRALKILKSELSEYLPLILVQLIIQCFF